MSDDDTVLVERVRAADLETDDRFLYGDVEVTVLEPLGSEPDQDIFGRPVWALIGRREDTGKVGKMHFGARGRVDKVVGE